MNTTQCCRKLRSQRFKIWSNYGTFDHRFDRFHEEVSKEEFNQIWEQVSKSLQEILEEVNSLKKNKVEKNPTFGGVFCF